MNRSNVGRTFKKGDVIVKQGEHGNNMYVIQYGTVEVVLEHDNKELVIGTLTEGDFFGEMALFLQESRAATVRVVDKARILTIDRKTFLKRIQQDPSIAFRIVEKLSLRIKDLNEKLMSTNGSSETKPWI